MPVNVGNGLNVTVPSSFTVYVPSPGTVRDVLVQLGAVSASFVPDVAGSSSPHNFTVDATSGALEWPGSSLSRMSITWFVSYGPVEVSFSKSGAGGTTGVRVLVAVWPAISVMRYVTEVLVPGAIDGDAAKVATPVVWFMVQVPSPGILTDVPHKVVAGSTKHGPLVEPDCKPVPVPSPLAPITVV